MPTMTKPVFSTLEPASAANDTLEVFEQNNFELDIRITVPHELRPMVDLRTNRYLMLPLVYQPPVGR